MPFVRVRVKTVEPNKDETAVSDMSCLTQSVQYLTEALQNVVRKLIAKFCCHWKRGDKNASQISPIISIVTTRVVTSDCEFISTS